MIISPGELLGVFFQPLGVLKTIKQNFVMSKPRRILLLLFC